MLPHIVLTGFMAVGKTAIGKRLAKRLHREFMDTDALIEQREGRKISDIFATDGEQAFRQIERDLITSLNPPEPSIIATGGGTYVDAANRERLHEIGIVVCLVTNIDTIVERVMRNSARPLVQDVDPDEARRRLETLLRERAPFYRKADVLVETDGLSVEQSVHRVMSMVEPRLKARREEPQAEVGPNKEQVGPKE